MCEHPAPTPPEPQSAPEDVRLSEELERAIAAAVNYHSWDMTTPENPTSNVEQAIGEVLHDHQRRADLCGTYGHPPVTYNPWHDETWCQCGRARTNGDRTEWPKPTDCGGYLVGGLIGAP